MGKPEQERVQHLLQDTVTLLCKNSLQFAKEMKVQGLLGVTLDDEDVFVVHINELYGPGGIVLTPEVVQKDKDKDKSSESGVVVIEGNHPSTPSKNMPGTPTPGTPSSATKRKRHSNTDVIDLEKEDEAAKRSRASLQVGNVQGNFANYNQMSNTYRSPGKSTVRDVSPIHLAIVSRHGLWLTGSFGCMGYSDCVCCLGFNTGSHIRDKVCRIEMVVKIIYVLTQSF
jgi:hypothetical protein